MYAVHIIAVIMMSAPDRGERAVAAIRLAR